MDNTLTTGIQQAGDTELIRLELVDTKNGGARYNLLGSFVDFTVYEDIFSPVLTGYIAIIETQNLISSIPIIGEELIVAEFATPSMRSMKCVFLVSKVGIREHQDKQNAYSLELISEEGFIDLNTKLSAAFSGNSGELVKSFYQTTFGKPLIDQDESDYFMKFVSPYWSPFKIINHVTSSALFPNSNMTTPNYLFYQTNRGHKYKSLSTLFAQEPVMEYFFDKNPAREHLSDGTSTRDIGREYKTIKELYFVAASDYVKNMLNGAFNHRVFTANLFRKKFDVKTYSFKNNFYKTNHTSEFPLVTREASKLSGLHTLQNVYPNLFNGINDIRDEIMAKRVSLLAQLETFKLNIVVHGRTDMEVGNMIYIWLNEFKTVDGTDTYKESYDPIYSGKYLVTAIQHRFTQAKHQMNMEIIKDSSLSEIKS